MSFAFIRPYIGVVIAAVLVAALAGWLRGSGAAIAAGYGAVIVLVTQLIQIWHLRRSERREENDAGRILRSAIACEIERYAAAIVLLVLGLKSWSLDPVSLLGGFILALIISVLSSFQIKSRVEQHGK